MVRICALHWQKRSVTDSLFMQKMACSQKEQIVQNLSPCYFGNLRCCLLPASLLFLICKLLQKTARKQVPPVKIELSCFCPKGKQAFRFACGKKDRPRKIFSLSTFGNCQPLTLDVQFLAQLTTYPSPEGDRISVQ